MFESLLVLASFHSEVNPILPPQEVHSEIVPRETECGMLLKTQMINNRDCAQFSQLVDWVPVELNLKFNQVRDQCALVLQTLPKVSGEAFFLDLNVYIIQIKTHFFLPL